MRLVTGEADLLRVELFPCLLRRRREPDELEESESVELSESESEDESLSLSLDEESELEKVKPSAISFLMKQLRAGILTRPHFSAWIALASAAFLPVAALLAPPPVASALCLPGPA